MLELLGKEKYIAGVELKNSGFLTSSATEISLIEFNFKLQW